MTRPKRRNYFIDKRFQTKYLLLTVLGLFVYNLLLLAAIFLPVLLPLGSDLPVAEQAHAARTFLLLHTHIWPAVGLVIAVMGILSIFVSHKIAGPAYRLSTSLQQVTAGDLDISVRLRKGDDLQGLADQVNAHLDELRSFVKTLETDHEILTASIASLEDRLKDDSPDDAAQAEVIAQLRESQKRLANTLNRFNFPE